MISTALGVPAEGERSWTRSSRPSPTPPAAHPEWAGQDGHRRHEDQRGLGRLRRGRRAGRAPRGARLRAEPDDRGAARQRRRLLGRHLRASSSTLLDADLIVAFPIFIETTEITDDPLWRKVPAVADGRCRRHRRRHLGGVLAGHVARSRRTRSSSWSRCSRRLPPPDRSLSPLRVAKPCRSSERRGFRAQRRPAHPLDHGHGHGHGGHMPNRACGRRGPG